LAPESSSKKKESKHSPACSTTSLPSPSFFQFTDYYGEQSCTAGRAAFITGQNPYRTGLTKVGMPGAKLGLSDDDPTMAQVMKGLGYATGQFGKNHLGELGWAAGGEGGRRRACAVVVGGGGRAR
jgi:arylsulfatase A-like enzyme